MSRFPVRGSSRLKSARRPSGENRTHNMEAVLSRALSPPARSNQSRRARLPGEAKARTPWGETANAAQPTVANEATGSAMAEGSPLTLPVVASKRWASSVPSRANTR